MSFMRPTYLASWLGRAAVFCSLASKTAGADSAPLQPALFVVTNVSQVRRLAFQNPEASHHMVLKGDIWWSNPTQGRLVLKDDSGAEELEIDLRGQLIQPGDQVRLVGNGTITRRGSA